MYFLSIYLNYLNISSAKEHFYQHDGPFSRTEDSFMQTNYFCLQKTMVATTYLRYKSQKQHSRNCNQ